MIRSKSIILSIIIIVFVFSLSMVSLTSYYGVVNTGESGYMVSVDQTNSIEMDDGEVISGEYDINKENMSKESKYVFETVKENTGIYDSQDAVLFEDKELLTTELISEPLVCNNCSVHTDMEQREDMDVETGMMMSDGYYQVSVDEYEPESEFNYIGFAFWSFILFSSSIALGIFVLRLR